MYELVSVCKKTVKIGSSNNPWLIALINIGVTLLRAIEVNANPKIPSYSVFRKSVDIEVAWPNVVNGTTNCDSPILPNYVLTN